MSGRRGGKSKQNSLATAYREHEGESGCRSQSCPVIKDKERKIRKEIKKGRGGITRTEKQSCQGIWEHEGESRCRSGLPQDKDKR